jgi:MFS family permease
VTRSPLSKALRRGDFRRFFLARTISQWGDTFNAVALVILVYRLTGSGLSVGVTVAFEISPVLLLGFVAGAVVDRLPRRAVMVSADLGRAAIAVLLAVFGHQLWLVYAAAFGLGAFSVFFDPAAASTLPALVDSDEEVLGANSAVWSAAVVSQIALAPAAGALVAFAGAGPAFGVNAASFIVSAALLMGLRVPAPRRQRSGRHFGEILEGLRFIGASRFLTTLAAVQALGALSAGATSALLVVLAERQYHLGAGRFGLLLGAIGVGAALGPLVLQRVVNEVRRPVFLFGPYLVRGLVDLILASASAFGVAIGALGLYGVGTSTGNVTYNTALQTTVPDRVRGRVFAFYDVIWQTARLASIGIGGLLADAIGIRAVYYLGGGILLIAAGIGFTRLRTQDLSSAPPLH